MNYWDSFVFYGMDFTFAAYAVDGPFQSYAYLHQGLPMEYQPGVYRFFSSEPDDEILLHIYPGDQPGQLGAIYISQSGGALKPMYTTRLGDIVPFSETTNGYGYGTQVNNNQTESWHCGSSDEDALPKQWAAVLTNSSLRVGMLGVRYWSGGVVSETVRVFDTDLSVNATDFPAARQTICSEAVDQNCP